jgi:3-dehydroquinate dehydratase-1
VVAPLCNQNDLDFVSGIEITDHCDVIELRLDCLAGHLGQTDALLSGNQLGVPTLATVRHPEEGGCGDLDLTARQNLLRRFLGQVDAIDIELRTADDMGTIIDAARCAGKTLILSYHDFKNTPSTATIRSKIDQAIAGGADVAKIAVHLDSLTSLFELAQVCESESRIKLSMMGMGPLGKLSRLVFAKAGSVLNYGYLKEANAPGQWPGAELKRLLGEL